MANKIFTKVISIHGKKGIHVKTQVFEYKNFYNTNFIINGEVVYKKTTYKPETVLTFGDLEDGESFIRLTEYGEYSDCWGDSEWIKVKKTYDNEKFNALLVNDNKKKFDIDSSAQLSELSDDTCVERLVEL
jgi:hypothetical protein